MIKLKENRGVTLLELLIVTGLIIVVLLPISLFFTSNLNNFYRENDKISAQSEVGRIMDLLTIRAMETEKYEIDGSKHKFITNVTDDEEWVFKHEGTILEYNIDKKDSDSLTEISENVSRFSIAPIIKNSKDIGIDIELEIIYRKEKCKLSNSVYFRNF